MHPGDLCTADTGAFQAANVNQPSSGIAGGILEHTPRILFGERLRCDFLFVERLHPLSDSVNIPRFKHQRRACNTEIGL